MPETAATQQDAELILKLYDLRREAVMREARNFMFGFTPKSVEDVVKLGTAFGTQENAYFRQVCGYWDMAASLVLRGALHEDLALDNFQEMFYVYSRLAPYLAAFRQQVGMPRIMLNVQTLVERSPRAQERVAAFEKRWADQASAQAEPAHAEALPGG